MNTRVLVLIALVAGVAIGLAYAWLIEPVTFVESSPAQVMKPYREAWLIMAAEAYAQDGDWERTQARVNALRDANLSQTLADLFDRYQANGPNPAARAVARLAGPPTERDPEIVRWDVLNGKVSPESARAHYGVVLNEDLMVNREETVRLRRHSREGGNPGLEGSSGLPPSRE